MKAINPTGLAKIKLEQNHHCAAQKTSLRAESAIPLQATSPRIVRTWARALGSSPGPEANSLCDLGTPVPSSVHPKEREDNNPEDPFPELQVA